MATTETGKHTSGLKQIPQRRDATYQFPVYRWLSWLSIAGYAIGLGCMYLIAGMFGIPAPLGWAFLVILFCSGIALLERPRQLLFFMMGYFLLMPGNRLLGLLGLPVPGFMDELFFIPFIAVIVMSWIQRSEMPKGSWFFWALLGLSAVSWYVNGKPSAFTTVRVTLVIMKFFILWYFCRLTCTFENMDQFWKWGIFYIYYAAGQFLYNCLWQGRPWVTHHWDNSGGVFGPDGTGAAHTVGYISILALFLLAAWWMGPGRTATKRRKVWMLLLGAVITYDLIFMTDTKHALLMMPLAFLPVLFHESVSNKMKLSLLGAGGVVAMLSLLYFVSFTSTSMSRFIFIMLDTPKGDAYQAVTRDFPYLVPYPLVGAGAGCFFSQQAVDSGAPLARRYVIPYVAEAQRARIGHIRGGTRTGGSLLAWPQCDVLTVVGEFGWLGGGIYAAFMIWVFVGLWRKASAVYRDSGHSGVYLALAAGMLFLCMTMLFASTCTVPCLMFPWWMLIGRMWDMKTSSSEEDAEKALEYAKHPVATLLEIPETP